MDDPDHKDIIQSWKTRTRDILKIGTSEQPRAIVIVTAHWSEDHPTISSGASHELYYDYYGFPSWTYSLKYGAKGSPDVAQQVYDQLKDAGLDPRLDTRRGWDHGVFVPLKVILPEEIIPIVQMSVVRSEDPVEHFKIGQAIIGLRDKNIAIMGSGSASFHNLRVLYNDSIDLPRVTREWSAVLNQTIAEEDSTKRIDLLSQWRRFPHAYTMHPMDCAEHFMPLIVSAGAAGDGKAGMYADRFKRMKLYSFYWT
jgi:aromatic ring-opening dioxygenase catalytic subunit (LigB family)